MHILLNLVQKLLIQIANSSSCQLIWLVDWSESAFLNNQKCNRWLLEKRYIKWVLHTPINKQENLYNIDPLLKYPSQTERNTNSPSCSLVHLWIGRSVDHLVLCICSISKLVWWCCYREKQPASLASVRCHHSSQRLAMKYTSSDTTCTHLVRYPDRICGELWPIPKYTFNLPKQVGRWMNFHQASCFLEFNIISSMQSFSVLKVCFRYVHFQKLGNI